MILLLDIGNTNIKWALAGDGALQDISAAPRGRAGTSELLDQCLGALQPPSSVCYASVAEPETGRAVEDWVARRWSVPVRAVSAQAQAGGVTNAYRAPRTLGVDRWLCVVAAWHRCRGPACVIDCGTAITIDGVDGEGRHLGGAIAPGPELMRRALFEGTSGIGAAPPAPSGFPAMDTAGAVDTGVLYAVAGFIDRGVGAMRGVLGDGMRCIITGGGAGTVQPLLVVEAEAVPELVLQGLAIIARDMS